MNLSQLKPPAGQVKKQRRVGQGMGSGRGKYSGRGAKGARSISGYSKIRGFEGGQMPLHRRLPKRGFTNPFKKEFALVNVGLLEKLEGDAFTPESLLASGVLSSLRDGLKVLANGALTRKISVKAHAFSEEAVKKITAAGGTVEKIEVRPAGPPPKPTRPRKSAGAAPSAPRKK
jgi:large subunit ribosomal protein L15